MSKKLKKRGFWSGLIALFRMSANAPVVLVEATEDVTKELGKLEVTSYIEVGVSHANLNLLDIQQGLLEAQLEAEDRIEQKGMSLMLKYGVRRTLPRLNKQFPEYKELWELMAEDPNMPK